MLKTKPCTVCGSKFHSKGYHKPRNFEPKLKPCKTCGSAGHYTSFCPNKPKKQLTSGPVYKRWSACKLAWYQLYGYDHSCHYCGISLTQESITLDHKISRGRAPELRYDFNNLVPCCYWDNNRKGSLDHDEYVHTCH